MYRWWKVIIPKPQKAVWENRSSLIRHIKKLNHIIQQSESIEPNFEYNDSLAVLEVCSRVNWNKQICKYDMFVFQFSIFSAFI